MASCIHMLLPRPPTRRKGPEAGTCEHHVLLSCRPWGETRAENQRVSFGCERPLTGDTGEVGGGRWEVGEVGEEVG